MDELLLCKNVQFLGMWTDPYGEYGTIPMLEIEELTCAEWNRRADEAQMCGGRNAKNQKSRE